MTNLVVGHIPAEILLLINYSSMLHTKAMRCFLKNIHMFIN